jgi:hypothetical protein
MIYDARTTSKPEKVMTMELKHPLPSSAVDAFHMMWGNFPEGVTLVHKSREIIATNKAAVKQGVLKAGMYCSSVGIPEMHKGCQANKALAECRAIYSFIPLPDGYSVGFWIPLDEHLEYFLHFSVGLTLNYRTGEPRDMREMLQLFQKTEN